MNQQLCHSSSHSVIVVLADTQLRQTRLILEIGSDLLGSGYDDDDVYHYIDESGDNYGHSLRFGCLCALCYILQ